MSGMDETQLKATARKKIEAALDLRSVANHTFQRAKAFGPLVEEAFYDGVERAEAQVDLEIRTYAHDFLGMVPKENTNVTAP